jgi:hypothetical protein
MNDTIPGIYNYCDRWCERCPLSNRCLLFLQELDTKSETEAEENTAFWEELESNMKENENEIEEFISDYDEFVPPDEEELEEVLKEMEETGEKARRSRLIQLCGVYRETLRPWLETHSDAEIRKLIYSRINISESRRNSNEKDHKMAADCMEVVQWYLFFMEAKFYRALTGKISGEEIRFEPDYPTDSEASAKVGMIAVDRSRQAIISLWDILPKTNKHDDLMHALSYLDQIKRESLREFPGATKIRRPGFDD